MTTVTASVKIRNKNSKTGRSFADAAGCFTLLIDVDPEALALVFGQMDQVSLYKNCRYLQKLSGMYQKTEGILSDLIQSR